MFPPQSRGGNIRGESVTGPRGYFLRPAVSQLGVGISSARRNSPGMSEKAFHQLNGRAMIRVTPLCPWFLAHHVKHFAMQLLTRTGRWRRRRWQRTGNLRRAAMNEFTNWKLRHPSCPPPTSRLSPPPCRPPFGILADSSRSFISHLSDRSCTLTDWIQAVCMWSMNSTLEKCF